VASIVQDGNATGNTRGNVTGVTVTAGLKILGKRMGLLDEAMSKLSTVGYVASRPFWESQRGEAAREAARQAGLSLKPALLGSAFDEAEYKPILGSVEKDGADALLVSDEIEHIAYRATIIEWAAKSRIPAVYPFREFVEFGGLMAYSIELADIFRRAASLIDKILRGANPEIIPFYRPTKFDLSINRKTARALGVEMPATLLGRADQMIE
jgi:putative ABC transport system substrate-binding protein